MAEHESAADEATPDDYEWDPPYAARAIAALREQLAAANERALEAETNATRYRKLNHDLALSAMLLLKRTTAERDKARARLAELKPLRTEWSTINSVVDPDSDILSEQFARMRVAKYPTIHTAVVSRQIYAGPWTPAADATAAAHSATLPADNGTQAREDANSSSILPQGLSEPEPPRDTSAWCWTPNPHGRLHCGLLKNHPPPHLRGERTWTDETGAEQ